MNVNHYRHLPNFLTIVRMGVIVLTFYFDDVVIAHQLSSFLFLIACITDFFDGYIARKFNLESNLGKMLDPIADKILVGTILIMLVKFKKASELPCILILIREFAVAGLREFLAEIRVSVPVTRLAKIKTFMQMTALFILLLGTQGSGISYLNEIGQTALWIAALITIFTGWSYFYAATKYF
jgi:cardiolipin synthase